MTHLQILQEQQKHEREEFTGSQIFFHDLSKNTDKVYEDINLKSLEDIMDPLKNTNQLGLFIFPSKEGSNGHAIYLVRRRSALLCVDTITNSNQHVQKVKRSRVQSHTSNILDSFTAEFTWEDRKEVITSKLMQHLPMFKKKYGFLSLAIIKV